jgi:hypothetical protein
VKPEPNNPETDMPHHFTKKDIQRLKKKLHRRSIRTRPFGLRQSGSDWPTAWEVKGPRSWDDALVKIKVAATAYPEVKWLLVWKHNGRWEHQEVLA